jgi:hypothetical protein
MDHAVALVEAYLRVNGFFTVTEYPIVEAHRFGGFRAATDLDVLAFRFPGAGIAPEGLVQGHAVRAEGICAPDPELNAAGNEPQMLIGEVKEGRAELNQAATDPAVLQAALTRFGCCEPGHVPAVVRNLLREGQAKTHCGHLVRLVAFGSSLSQVSHPKFKVILLGHVERFLFEFIRHNWEAVHSAQFKDPAFGFLVMQQKARLGCCRDSVHSVEAEAATLPRSARLSEEK